MHLPFAGNSQEASKGRGQGVGHQVLNATRDVVCSGQIHTQSCMCACVRVYLYVCVCVCVCGVVGVGVCSGPHTGLQQQSESIGPELFMDSR
jgi:hypothetical protein